VISFQIAFATFLPCANQGTRGHDERPIRTMAL
jgi:hypothetical protein